MLIRKIQKNKKNQIYKKKKKKVEGQTSLTIPFSPQPPTATLIPSPLSSPKTNNPAHRPPPLQAKAFAPPRTIFPSAISTSKNLNQPYFFSSAPSRLLPWLLPFSRYGRSPPPSLLQKRERTSSLSFPDLHSSTGHSPTVSLFNRKHRFSSP